jgi:adenosylcobinamide-phosphate synthase
MESIAIISAYLLDLIMGDPRWFPHPVKGMGRLIVFLEQRLRKGQEILRIKGALAAVIVVGTCTFSVYVLLYFLKRVNPSFEIVAWILLGYTSLACGDLFCHARHILERLENKDIEGARKKLSLIVGRDTNDLSVEKIITATIESIAENTNDGIIAPLFYLVLGGPVLAIGYKAINTLDSMIGYKNERYRYFGWFSAKLDDIVNFIPARITGMLITVSSFFLGYGFRNSFDMVRRDGHKHISPNSGISEAAMAGALGIRLGGPSRYGGRLLAKPYIGEEKNTIQPVLINKALNVTFLASAIMVIIGACLRWAI